MVHNVHSAYNIGMEVDPQNLADQALSLPESARAALAATLIHSLDVEADDESDLAWKEEIAKRISEIDRGDVKMIPWG